MRCFVSGACLVLLGASCSFIDSFDYEFTDAAIPDATVDGSEDATIPTTCDPPCLSDAILDFSDADQEAGPLQWRYLADDKNDNGVTYYDLVPDRVFDAPGWSDDMGTFIVACGESTTGACAEADGSLVLGTRGGDADPVLAFRVPSSGDYSVEVVARALEGSAELLLSRNARHDIVGARTLDAGEAATVVGAVELFEREAGLITVRSSVPGDSVTLSLRARVSSVAGPPLAACEMAARFHDARDLRHVECADVSATEVTGRSTTDTPGPTPELGQGRAFPSGTGLMTDGAFFDYSEDFTVQLWMRVDTLTDAQTTVYLDWRGMPPNPGGIRFGLEPSGNRVTVGYLFPVPASATPPPIACSDDNCFGELESELPDLGGWHFYRFVRDTAASEARLCIDGVEVDSGLLPNDVDMSNPVSPMLGTNISQSTFEGALDDIRVFSRALPCGAN